MNDDDLDLDLHTWRVPAPAPVDPSALVARALSPAMAPAKRPRLVWIAAAIVLINAAIAALLVIVLARSSAPRPTALVLPAGGGSCDATVRDLIARLEQQQRELEHQHQIEDEKLRALVVELQDELRRRDHTPPPPPDAGCDEVSCVLDNYTGTCCAKFLRQPPEALDRAAISNAMAAVRSRVLACGDRSPPKGMVTVHVAVAGNGTVSSVSVESAPSTELGTCVAAAVRQASFAHTQRGGSFSYPFVF